MPFPQNKSLMVIKANLPGSKPYFIINCYIDPGIQATTADMLLGEIGDLWDTYIEQGKVVVLGDFNCPITTSITRVRKEGVSGKIITPKFLKLVSDRAANILNPHEYDVQSNTYSGNFSPTHFTCGRSRWSNQCLDYCILHINKYIFFKNISSYSVIDLFVMCRDDLKHNFL